MTDSRADVIETLRENWFWSGIFRDHATFIFDNLAPDEEQIYRWARSFQQSFDRLHNEAEDLATQAGVPGPAGSYAAAGELPKEPGLSGHGAELLRYDQQSRKITRALQEGVASLRAFKQDLVHKKLECQVKLGLGPTLLNHMILEAEEAQRTLARIRESAPLPPALQALHHHLIWLPDAAGHSAALHSGLDGTEEKLLDVTTGFKRTFNGMHIKALELYAMLRVAPRMAGALKRLNLDAVAQIGHFRAFLTELREHLEGCEVLVNNLMPLLADHMLREELYYTEKLLQIE